MDRDAEALGPALLLLQLGTALRRRAVRQEEQVLVLRAEARQRELRQRVLERLLVVGQAVHLQVPRELLHLLVVADEDCQQPPS